MHVSPASPAHATCARARARLRATSRKWLVTLVTGDNRPVENVKGSSRLRSARVRPCVRAQAGGRNGVPLRIPRLDDILTREGLDLDDALAALVDAEIASSTGARRIKLAVAIDLCRAHGTVTPLRRFFERSFTKRGEETKRPTKAERPRCGARCRSKGGAPCVAPVVCRRNEHGRIVMSRRCRMHGGLSTGAKTPEGRRRCAEAARRRWERWRQQRERGAS